jgi:hypothetical protein
MSSRRGEANTQYENKQLVDTVKALIEVYKSAFGNRWKAVFIKTVAVGIETP